MSKFKDLAKLRRALGVTRDRDERTCKDCIDYREVTFEKMYCQEYKKFWDSHTYICTRFRPRDGSRF